MHLRSVDINYTLRLILQLGTVTDTQCDNDNRKQYKYVCITTYQTDTKSNPYPNPTTKQHTIVYI